jgi:AraC-like DNA-binding protein
VTRPLASTAWEPALRRLSLAAKRPNAGPSWWTGDLSFFGAIESRDDPRQYVWDGMKRTKKADRPFFFFQFSLAGWGTFEQHGHAAQRITPGTGFFAVVPSRHRYYLPPDSPGWTFGWLNVYHPYLIERVARQIAATGPVVRVTPTSALLGSALRLITASYKKDFRDRFEVELAVFEFVIAYERFAHQSQHPADERHRLLEAVETWVLSNPRRELGVASLAAEYGMSRSHFSHFFRARTGQSPARVMTQARVQRAAQMLHQGNASLKQVAEVCGFANANHFNRVFHRFLHMSPGAYRNIAR